MSRSYTGSIRLVSRTVAFAGVSIAALLGIAIGGPRVARASAAAPGKSEATRGYFVAVEGGAGLGVLFPTTGRVIVSAGRTLVDRFDLALDLRGGFASDTLLLEPGVRLGVRVHLPRRFDLVASWRFGYAAARKDLPNGRLWVHLFAASPALGVHWRFARAWALWVTPLAVTGYLADGLWGVIAEPTAGVAFVF